MWRLTFDSVDDPVALFNDGAFFCYSFLRIPSAIFCGEKRLRKIVFIFQAFIRDAEHVDSLSASHEAFLSNDDLGV